MPLKIGLIGATLWGNRGAEAMLVTTIGRLRRTFPDARFVIFSYSPSKDREILADPTIAVAAASPKALVLAHFPWAVIDRLLRSIGLRPPRGLLPRSARELRELDVLLDLFGVSYADGRERFLPFNVLSNWPAMLFGVPVVKLAQSAGPFHNPLNRWIGRWMLGKCEKIHARGEATRRYLDELGIASDPSPDVAFLYEPDYSLTEENPDVIANVRAQLAAWKTSGHPIVGFSVSKVVKNMCDAHGMNYCAILSAAAVDLIDHGRRVVFLPNATRGSEPARTLNDLPIIEQVLETLRTRGAPYAEAATGIRVDVNTRGLRQVISECDVLVASRFHGMIAALCEEVPLLVVGWGHKYEDTLREFGLAELSIDFSSLKPGDLAAGVGSLLERREQYRLQIRRHLPEVKRAADQAFNWLEGFLKARAR
ncbi:MAG: colanic acid biosynthesis protein [candidate division BRC1 bacterium ADurb.BinA292]|nr:MAG: colanic acid biosynthesis protein [candidate division BRC1 bacterium ADurb.BinA292]